MDALAGCYVHLPFCARRCTYCAFPTGTDRSLAGATLGGILAEAERRAPAWPGPFGSLYLGGGTPTVLDDDEIARLVEGLRARLPLARGAEVTIEANPDDLLPGRAARLQALGFDRIALGVQPLRAPALVLLGRRPAAAAAARAVREARAAGFATVSIDLIAGRPGQREAAWEAELVEALALGPDHLSVYLLSVEPDTPLAGRVERGEVRAPTEARQAAIYRRTCRILEREGWGHDEVSSWSRAPAFRARHNARYWARVPVLGLGPAAHAFDGSHRWWNLPAPGPYLAALAAGRLPEEGAETLDEAAVRLECLALGLRTAAGVPVALLLEAPDGARTLERALARGLLVEDGDRVRPTAHGFLFADGLARAFAG